MQTQDNKIWIIQRCINAFTNHYEDWPGYCEQPMTREEMILALEKCNHEWPNHEFRGHNINSESKPHAFGEYPKFN
jgi:hypothetical protein